MRDIPPNVGCKEWTSSNFVATSKLPFCWLYVRDKEILLGIFLVMMNLGDGQIDVSNNVETTANKNLEYST